MTAIAYLAPELPALSATFVYEELLGLERRGHRIVPITVRKPASPAKGQDDLAARTRVLYDSPVLESVLRAVVLLPGFGRGTWAALAMLLRDMLVVGPWRPVAWKLAYQCLMGARLGRLLLREHCSHVHVHFANTPAQIAMYASAFSGVPFSVMAHANDIFERGLLLAQKGRRAVAMMTVSNFNRDYLRARGVAEDRLAVVRCCFTFAERECAPSFGPKQRFRVGTLCRLVEKKGVDDLIRAVALLGGAPDVELRIAGDGPARQALESLVFELGLGARVHFEGPIAHNVVSEWMRTLDAFAIACKRDANGDMDGIPVALMEAMSQRVPVLSTRLSGIPELVIDDRTGLLAQPGDPASMAAALRRLLGDATLCERLTEAAVRHVRTEFAQDVNLDRLLRRILPESPEAH